MENSFSWQIYDAHSLIKPSKKPSCEQRCALLEYRANVHLSRWRTTLLLALRRIRDVVLLIVVRPTNGAHYRSQWHDRVTRETQRSDESPTFTRCVSLSTADERLTLFMDFFLIATQFHPWLAIQPFYPCALRRSSAETRLGIDIARDDWNTIGK